MDKVATQFVSSNAVQVAHTLIAEMVLGRLFATMVVGGKKVPVYV